MCLFGLLVILQVFKIQYVETIEGKKWQDYAKDRVSAERPIPANRGNIYNEEGHLLATSYPVFRLNWDAISSSDHNFYNNLDSLATCLTDFFNINSVEKNRQKLIEAREKGKRYVKIPLSAKTVYINYPDLQKLIQFPLFRLGQFKGGLIVSQKDKRKMPFGQLAHRTIGYVRDEVAVGLEGYYNGLLAGVEGRRFEQKISSGDWIPINDEYIIKPENGKDIITTIDTYIQDIAYDALMKMIRKQSAHHGCAIVMEVKTGKIRAIANIGMREDSSYAEIFNYAVGEETEPGSTMKLASMIAAIENGAVSDRDTIDVKDGTFSFYDKVMKDSDDKHQGVLKVKRAFEVSSNVAISRIIHENFNKIPEQFIAYLEKMGLTQKTGVDIKGEPEPYIKDPKDRKNWTGITLPWMSVGYELKLTPLQTLTLYNAVANDGVSMKPYLISGVNDGGISVEKVSPSILQPEICSESTIRSVRSMLEGVVENGTAKNIQPKHFKIAGKTGTSKIAKKKSGYGNSYQASFAGYFPAESPMYSCIVVINRPSKGDYYGSSVAAPVFKEIAEKVFAKKVVIAQNVAKGNKALNQQYVPYVKAGLSEEIVSLYSDLGIDVLDSKTTHWSKPKCPDKKVSLTRNAIYNNEVPNVRDMCLKDALFLLENRGFKVHIKGKGKGKVRFQSIRGGTKITNTTNPEIEITVS
jgi:cell division protein FtsI (penicillin-binding protein 3)